MASLETAKYIATGTIRPCRFVKQTGDFQCQEADAGEEVVGISQEFGRVAPIPDVATINAAETGDQLIVYGDGQITQLEAGAAFAQGVFLKSDADGKGVLGAANLDKVGAYSLQASGGDGEKVLVRVATRERSV